MGVELLRVGQFYLQEVRCPVCWRIGALVILKGHGSDEVYI